MPASDRRVARSRLPFSGAASHAFTNASTSAGVGGSPVKSSDSRRISVRIFRPRLVLHARQCWPLRRDERPVLLPLRPFRDPAPQRLDLPCGQRDRGGRRRHPSSDLVGGRDSLNQLARLARHDGEVAAQIDAGAFLGVETQPRLAFGLVRPMTLKARIRQDRPNIAIERNKTEIPAFSSTPPTSGSRPRKLRYASAGSTVLPTEKTYLTSRAATFLSYGPPASVNASNASAVSTSDQR